MVSESAFLFSPSVNLITLFIYSNFLSIENLAVIFSIGFVIFNAKGKIISWPLGIIGSALYIWVFITAKIYGDALLQFFYVLMGIYGWVQWRSAIKNDDVLPIISAKLSHLLKYLLIGLILVPIFGFLLDNRTDSDIPYWDAFTTVFSFIATFMMAKKILENWLFWIVIDLICIFIYAFKGLNSTVLLFVIYTLMAVYGFINWKLMLKKQKQNA